MDENPDYITVEKTIRGPLVCVLLMKWSPQLDSYVGVQCSRAMTPLVAAKYARTWAVERGVEVR